MPATWIISTLSESVEFVNETILHFAAQFSHRRYIWPVSEADVIFET